MIKGILDFKPLMFKYIRVKLLSSYREDIKSLINL